jgi:head-tail adaptor
MAYAGDYYDRATRLIRSVSKNAQNGQEEETFTEGNTFWCRIDYANSRRQKDYGADQTGADGTIYIRNYPTLSPLDRLYSQEWGEVWIIESIKRGNNELICECTKYDDLAL